MRSPSRVGRTSAGLGAVSSPTPKTPRSCSSVKVQKRGGVPRFADEYERCPPSRVVGGIHPRLKIRRDLPSPTRPSMRIEQRHANPRGIQDCQRPISPTPRVPQPAASTESQAVSTSQHPAWSSALINNVARGVEIFTDVSRAVRPVEQPD